MLLTNNSFSNYSYPWTNIKPLIRKKVELVLDEFHEQHPMPAAVPAFNFEELKKEIVDSLDSFSGAPFTIQRICELLTLPTKHYKRTDKFMRGLEKNVLVVSHVDPKTNAGAERPASPPKSIFAPEPSYHLFERSLNANSHSLQPSTSSQNDPEAGPSSLDSARSLSDSEAGTSSSSLSSSVSSKIILPSMSMSSSTEPAPLQQLDSFTTVFSSPPSTPLAVVSNMGPFESASSSSSSSSSGSSAESSPQPPGDPCSPDDLENGENEENGQELESQTSSLDSSSSEASGGDMSSQEQVNQQGDILVDNASNVQSSSNEQNESVMSADEVSEEKVESISPPQSEAMEVAAAEATESQPTATEVQSQEQVNFGTAPIEQKEEMQTEEETESKQEEQSEQPLEELQGTLV